MSRSRPNIVNTVNLPEWTGIVEDRGDIGLQAGELTNVKQNVPVSKKTLQFGGLLLAAMLAALLFTFVFTLGAAIFGAGAGITIAGTLAAAATTAKIAAFGTIAYIPVYGIALAVEKFAIGDKKINTTILGAEINAVLARNIAVIRAKGCGFAQGDLIAKSDLTILYKAFQEKADKLPPKARESFNTVLNAKFAEIGVKIENDQIKDVRDFCSALRPSSVSGADFDALTNSFTIVARANGIKDRGTGELMQTNEQLQIAVAANFDLILGQMRKNAQENGDTIRANLINAQLQDQNFKNTVNHAKAGTLNGGDVGHLNAAIAAIGGVTISSDNMVTIMQKATNRYRGEHAEAVEQNRNRSTGGVGSSFAL